MDQYFWDGEKVIVAGEHVFEKTPFPYMNYLSLDDGTLVPRYRWGRWVPAMDMPPNTRSWEHVPYKDMPKEFKLALLLMGVDVTPQEG